MSLTGYGKDFTGMFKEKEKANALLRYSLTLLRGGGCRCPPGVRLSLVLSLKDELKSMGALWQVKILNNHLHKAQKGFMTQQRRGGCLK